MKRSDKRRRALSLLLAVLVLALLAVVGVILFKQHEYAVSARYYQGLRGLLGTGAVRA